MEIATSFRAASTIYADYNIHIGERTQMNETTLFRSI